MNYEEFSSFYKALDLELTENEFNNILERYGNYNEGIDYFGFEKYFTDKFKNITKEVKFYKKMIDYFK